MKCTDKREKDKHILNGKYETHNTLQSPIRIEKTLIQC